MRQEIDIRMQLLKMEIELNSLEKSLFGYNKVKKAALKNNITILKWVLEK